MNILQSDCFASCGTADMLASADDISRYVGRSALLPMEQVAIHFLRSFKLCDSTRLARTMPAMPLADDVCGFNLQRMPSSVVR